LEKADTRRFITAARLRWLLVVGLLAANVVFFAMGSLAAAVGGGLTDWGNGAGGLGGWADGSITIFSIVVGIAAGLATFREGRSIPVAMAVLVTGLLIGVGFLEGGHLVDPCARGWWDFSNTVGDTRLCSTRGDIDERFHLLLHASIGVLAASIAAFVYRRRSLFGWWPPEAI
jgi:hypothetical protein